MAAAGGEQRAAVALEHARERDRVLLQVAAFAGSSRCRRGMRASGGRGVVESPLDRKRAHPLDVRAARSRSASTRGWRRRRPCGRPFGEVEGDRSSASPRQHITPSRAAAGRASRSGSGRSRPGRPGTRRSPRPRAAWRRARLQRGDVGVHVGDDADDHARSLAAANAPTAARGRGQGRASMAASAHHEATAARKASGHSSWGRWPQPSSSTSRRAPGTWVEVADQVAALLDRHHRVLEPVHDQHGHPHLGQPGR